MENQNKRELTRRQFIKRIGMGSLAAILGFGVIPKRAQALDSCGKQSYWRYAYQPPQVPQTEAELFIRSIEYLVVGQEQIGGKTYHVLFTTYQTTQGPVPSLSLTPENSVWDGGLSPTIEVAFPLEVGQARTKVIEIEGETITVAARVLALESVTVPAGTFEAFHIQYRENGEIFADLWYSLMIQSFVKRTSVASQMAQRFRKQGIVAGTLVLEEVQEFPPQTALNMMFQTLREIAQDRPDLVLPIVQKLIDLGIAPEEAQALGDELLSPSRK